MSEKEIKENIDESRRYLKNLLIECSFFKTEKVELTEKEKLNHADYKILQYSKEDINRLLDFIIFFKNNENNKIITNQVFNEKKEKDLKRVNHYFYDNLLYPSPDTNIEKFMIVLLDKISRTEYIDESLIYKFLMAKFFNEHILNEYSKDIKKKVRTFFLIHPKEEARFRKKYEFIDVKAKEKKVMRTLPLLLIPPYKDTFLDTSYILHFNDKKNLPPQIEQMFFRYYLFFTQIEFMEQMVVYDLFNENFSEFEREKHYKEIYSFLENKKDEIQKSIEKFYLNKNYKESENIFIDFFCFLYIRHKLYFVRNGFEIGLKLREADKQKYIPPIDEFLNFQYFLQKNKNLNSKKGFFLGKNIDNPKIKEILKKKGYSLLKNSDIDEVLKDYQSTNKTLLKVYSQEKQKNTFKNIEENIDKILKEFNFPLDSSLQTRKGIIKFIEEDKTKLNLGSNRITLKALFTSDKYKNYWNTETVRLNLRLRISRENFREKGKLDSFQYDMKIEYLINEIALIIFSFNDIIEQEKLLRNFLVEYEAYYMKLMKNYKYASTKLKLQEYLQCHLKMEETIEKLYGDNSKIMDLINTSRLFYEKK